MKKLLIATLFAVFTLSANAQTEEVVENKSEITTTIHLNFETSIKKIEDVYSVKKLLYNVRKNRETNKFKTEWVLEKIKNKVLTFKVEQFKDPVIACMGLAFKPNIDDLRESPAKYIAQKVLQDSNNEIHFIVEPNIEEHNVFKLTDYETALEEADIIAFLVAHNEFKNLKLSEDKTLLDFCGIYK